MAYAVLGARPNSHPFQERKVSFKEPCKVGRAVAKSKPSTNNLIFDCKVLSRSHAIIWYENEKFLIQDTKSSNGTYVNSVQVGRNADDSEIIELHSGDILQFGVDVTENSKKVTHGCIIAMVTLFNPDGTEALGEPEKPIGRVLPFVDGEQNMKAKELWQLSKYIQDALNREQLLEQKLATMQRMIANSSTCSDEAFQAFVKEDELLSRLDILENELDVITKDLPEDDNRKLLITYQEEKETYESKAKEAIQRLIEEKSDVLQKLADIQRTLSYSEDECAHFKSLYEKSEEDIRDLMDRNEHLAQELKRSIDQLETVESRQKIYEKQVSEDHKKLKLEKGEAEKRASTLAVQIESLQAECDFTKEQLFAVKDKLDKHQNDVTKLSESSNQDHSDGDISLLSTSYEHAYDHILVELKENLIEMKKRVRSLSSTSVEEVSNENDLETSNLSVGSMEDEVDFASTLEYVSNLSKQINDELSHVSGNVDIFNENEERELRHQLQSAETEMFKVHLEIDELNANLKIEQQNSQRYKDLATEFEVRLIREECRRNQLISTLDAMNNRLKQLQERIDRQEQEKFDSEEGKSEKSRIEKVVEEFINESAVHQLENENIPADNIETPQTLEEVSLGQSFNSESDVGTIIGTNEEDVQRIDKLERKTDKDSKTAKSKENQMFYLMFALIAVFVAIGAAFLLDVINVSLGNSPIFDKKTWREIYEQFF